MRILSFCFAWALAAAPVGAETATYACRLKVPSTQFWVPDQIVIRQDSQTGAVAVEQESLCTCGKTPVAPRLLSETEKKLRFEWVLKDLKTTRGRISKIRYTAQITRATGEVFVRAEIAGVRRAQSAKGMCEKQ